MIAREGHHYGRFRTALNSGCFRMGGLDDSEVRERLACWVYTSANVQSAHFYFAMVETRQRDIVPMPSRVRHCVECPKCLTRYLVGFSPYTNGSYLRPLSQGLWEEWILYCACRLPHASSRWNWKELKLCEVSYQAHQTGYGAPDEIIVISQASSLSG